MLWFDGAPAIPSNYARLRVLSAQEMALARAAAYVADDAADPSEPVRRAGLDNCTDPPTFSDMQDWRIWMYVIWFCYIYENFSVIRMPLMAIEELILEFKAPNVLDTPDRRIASLYAGAGARDPISEPERASEMQELKPHYDKALLLLEGASAR
jgi:hypothetical protein